MTIREPDVVVVGGGITGISVAMHLADAGFKVTLFDRGDPSNATSAAFGELSAFGVSDPSHYLLAAGGMSDWRRWGWRLGTDPGLRWDGSLRLAVTESAEARLCFEADRALGRGYPVVPIDEDQTPPGLRFDEVRYGVALPSDGVVEPSRLEHTTRSALEAAGVVILPGVEATCSWEEGALTVRSDAGTSTPRRAVITSGAGSQVLARSIGTDIPLAGAPGLTLVTTPLYPSFSASVHLYDDEGEIAMRQDEGGRLIVSTTDRRAVRTGERTRALLRRAAKVFPPTALAEIETAARAWRAVPADGLPVIGPLLGADEAYVALGHPGVTMAPAIGRLIASEFSTGEPTKQLSSFRPDRFIRRDLQTAMSIESAFYDL